MRDLSGNLSTKKILQRSLIFAILPTLILTVLIVFDRWNTGKLLYLSVSMKSSVNAVAQVFYDIGRGLNESDSVALPITKENNFLTLRFPLSSKPIQYIRFDPLNKEGRVLLKDIKIVNSVDRVIQHVNLQVVQPLYQIKHIVIEDNVLMIKTVKTANDPQLFLSLAYPLVDRIAISTLLIWAFVTSFGILGVLCISFFLIFQLSLQVKRFCFSLRKSDILINLLILLIFSSGSIVIGYYIYNHVKQPPEPIIYRGLFNDYALSFYNRKGQRITELEGPFKLMTDPFTIYKNYPEQKSPSYSINANGFRDGYISSNSSRIAMVLGGSAAFGQGLDENNKTFASKISYYNPKYNVINSAVIGFASGQELSQMIHYLDDFHPSLYLVFDGWNDIFAPYMHANKWPVNGGPIGFNNVFLAIEDRLAAYFQMTGKEKDQTIASLPPAGELLNEAEYFQKICEKYLSNISKMNSFANARGAEFLLVFQPELGNKKSKTPDEREMLNDWNNTYKYLEKEIPQKYKKLIDKAKKICEEQNIEWIDINDESEFSENPQILFYDVVHPNELGHEIIAKIINKVLSNL